MMFRPSNLIYFLVFCLCITSSFGLPLKDDFSAVIGDDSSSDFSTSGTCYSPVTRLFSNSTYDLFKTAHQINQEKCIRESFAGFCNCVRNKRLAADGVFSELFETKNLGNFEREIDDLYELSMLRQWGDIGTEKQSIQNTIDAALESQDVRIMKIVKKLNLHKNICSLRNSKSFNRALDSCSSGTFSKVSDSIGKTLEERRQKDLKSLEKLAGSEEDQDIIAIQRMLLSNRIIINTIPTVENGSEEQSSEYIVSGYNKNDAFVDTMACFVTLSQGDTESDKEQCMSRGIIDSLVIDGILGSDVHLFKTANSAEIKRSFLKDVPKPKKKHDKKIDRFKAAHKKALLMWLKEKYKKIKTYGEEVDAKKIAEDLFYASVEKTLWKMANRCESHVKKQQQFCQKVNSKDSKIYFISDLLSNEELGDRYLKNYKEALETQNEPLLRGQMKRSQLLCALQNQDMNSLFNMNKSLNGKNLTKMSDYDKIKSLYSIADNEVIKKDLSEQLNFEQFDKISWKNESFSPFVPEVRSESDLKVVMGGEGIDEEQKLESRLSESVIITDAIRSLKKARADQRALNFSVVERSKPQAHKHTSTSQKGLASSQKTFGPTGDERSIFERRPPNTNQQVYFPASLSGKSSPSGFANLAPDSMEQELKTLRQQLEAQKLEIEQYKDKEGDTKNIAQSNEASGTNRILEQYLQTIQSMQENQALLEKKIAALEAQKLETEKASANEARPNGNLTSSRQNAAVTSASNSLNNDDGGLKQPDRDDTGNGQARAGRLLSSGNETTGATISNTGTTNSSAAGLRIVNNASVINEADTPESVATVLSNSYGAYQVKQLAVSGDRFKLSQLPAGQFRFVSRGLSYVVIYKDENGEVYEYDISSGAADTGRITVIPKVKTVKNKRQPASRSKLGGQSLIQQNGQENPNIRYSDLKNLFKIIKD